MNGRKEKALLKLRSLFCFYRPRKKIPRARAYRVCVRAQARVDDDDRKEACFLSLYISFFSFLYFTCYKSLISYL